VNRLLPVIARAAGHGSTVAVDGPDGTWGHDDLLRASADLAAVFLDGHNDLDGERVAFLVEPGGRFVAVLWGIWRAGGIAVPLALSHPTPELDHVIGDSGASIVVVDPALADRVETIVTSRGIRVVEPPANVAPAARAEGGGTPVLPDVDEGRKALMVYTSGTTGRPKGAVHTHRGIRANIEVLVEAWGWSPDDRTLLVLPLHHVHGLVNVVCCALWSGARCDMLPRFDEAATFERISAEELTVFMAVPTIYARLVSAWDSADDDAGAAFSAGCRAMRLMVSGSAALPVSTLMRWREISGHTLLERYGMTEIGMALSNPLDGERRPGHVGTPLPGVEVRLVDDTGRPAPPGEPGEIEVRGPNVFLEYWGRPDATDAAFNDGWFRTGDTAVVADGAYRILGRNSVDILKVAGYKVSALEVEDVLRDHPAVGDCAVVGLPDDVLGQRIAVAAVAAPGATIDPDEIRAWARERMASYKVPHVVLPVPALPRNSMGKVTKPNVSTLFG